MEYKHFSHHHTMALHKVQPGQQFQCRGCNLPCNDSIFACFNCSFFLHYQCGNAARYMNHPSHPSHPLILMPNPTYCSGSFLCNACGPPGNTLSYCCALCEVDLHLSCAFLPPKLSHGAHHHALQLSFERPESVDQCKICAKEISSRHWSYCCNSVECSFRVHTFCGASEVKSSMYHGDEVGSLTSDQKTQEQMQMEMELSPEEVMMLEMSRMKMELQMAQALADIIAFK